MLAMLGMVNKHASFMHHFRDVAMTQWIRRMPANAHHIDVNWQAHSLGRRRRFSSLFSNIAQHRPADGLTSNATQASALLDLYQAEGNVKALAILKKISPVA